MVTAIMIVELLGRPKEHAAQALEDYVGKLDDLKHVEVIKKQFSEPTLAKDDADLFICHCEIEFSCETLQQLVNIVFDFMPASIEVVEPSKLSFESSEATDLLNALSGRLHRYDNVVKIVQNNQKKVAQEMAIARKLLIDNKIIDEKGAILKKGDSQESSSSEEDSQDKEN